MSTTTVLSREQASALPSPTPRVTPPVSPGSTPSVAAAPPAETTVGGAKKADKPKRTATIMTVLGLIAATAGGAYWYSHRGLESTDDAQIDAEIVSVPTRASGLVTKVLFVENQAVKAGDVLAELDADSARARLAQAEATLEAAKAGADAADADDRVAETNARSNKTAAEAGLQGASSSASASKEQIAEGQAFVASATANLARATQDRDRAKNLVESGALAQAQLDQLESTVNVDRAALEQAKAHLAALQDSTSQALRRVQEANAKVQQTSNVDAFIAQARARARVAHAQVSTAQAARDIAALDLTYTRITAPQDGVVSKKTIAVGQMVAPGQGIGQLVTTQKAWVTGNFKETQLTRMHPGQPAHFTIDAYPGVTIHGEVESLSAATGARFTLLPPDNASGNFTKVVQRVPVRIHLTDLPQGIAPRPGMSVELTVDTNK